MGYRLSKIYTRTGDDGTTGLGDGSRVKKDDCRVSAYGTVDELNSHIGVLISLSEIPEDISVILSRIQNDLFNVGGEFSVPDYVIMAADDVTQLEQWIDHYNQDLPPLKNFILPGGTQASAYMHVVRAVSRRAERDAITFAQQRSNINPIALQYLNRLSDLFFVLARVLQRRAGLEEVLWRRKTDS